MLERAGATAIASGHDTLTIAGCQRSRSSSCSPSTRVPFAEVSAHRATLEQAYLDITRDAVEFRAEPTAEVAQ